MTYLLPLTACGELVASGDVRGEREPDSIACKMAAADSSLSEEGRERVKEGRNG